MTTMAVLFILHHIVGSKGCNATMSAPTRVNQAPRLPPDHTAFPERWSRNHPNVLGATHLFICFFRHLEATHLLAPQERSHRIISNIVNHSFPFTNDHSSNNTLGGIWKRSSKGLCSAPLSVMRWMRYLGSGFF